MNSSSTSILNNETQLNHEDKNPLDWSIQLNKKQNEITVKNISENITHIISLPDENAAERSPVIAREMSQNNSVPASPLKVLTLS